MKLLPLLCLLGAVLASDPPSGYGPSINEVEALIKSLEVDLTDLQVGISSAQTLCSVGWDRLQVIQDKKITAINLKDSQQNALIIRYRDQIKDLQHRTDDALATAASAKQRTIDTAAEIAYLSAALKTIYAVNDNQNGVIANLSARVANDKEFIIGKINDSIIYLDQQLLGVRNRVDIVHQFVDSRKCEYGFVSVNLDDKSAGVRVDFKTVFTEVPTVAIDLVGFSAHLDVAKYGSEHEYDILGIDKFVGPHSVDEKGFVARSEDGSSGSIDVKTVYCSWMACQNIDDIVPLPRHR